MNMNWYERRWDAKCCSSTVKSNVHSPTITVRPDWCDQHDADYECSDYGLWHYKPHIVNGSASVASPSASNMNTSNLSQLPPLNPSTTHITNILLLNSEQHICSLSPSEIENTKKWMNIDRKYNGRLRAMKGQMSEELRDTFKPALNAQGMPFGQPADK
jgi:hypothetical protein